MTTLEQPIEALWDDRDSLSPATTGDARDAVNTRSALVGQGAVEV